MPVINFNSLGSCNWLKMSRSVTIFSFVLGFCRGKIQTCVYGMYLGLLGAVTWETIMKTKILWEKKKWLYASSQQALHTNQTKILYTIVSGKCDVYLIGCIKHNTKELHSIHFKGHSWYFTWFNIAIIIWFTVSM